MKKKKPTMNGFMDYFYQQPEMKSSEWIFVYVIHSILFYFLK